MKKLLLLVCLFFSYQLLKAQVLTENFAYTGGTDLAGQGGWALPSTDAASGGDAINVASTGLLLGNYIPRGGGAVKLSGVKNFYVKELGSSYSKTSKKALYASFLLKVDASGTSALVSNYFFSFKEVESGKNTRGRVYIASTDNDKFSFGITFQGASEVATSAVYEKGKVYLVVLKLELLNPAVVSLYVFDKATDAATEPTTPLLQTDPSLNTSEKNISAIHLQQNSDQDMTFDGLVISEEWPNVTSLPVKLTSFAGAVQNSTVKLNWVTASEQNNSHFEVLRSEDGKTFNTLTSVSGNGTTQSVNNYSYIDANPLSGTNYYQLRQVDFDGKSELSKVIAVKTAMEKTSLSVYATSASGFAEISSYSLANQKAVIRISSVSGSHIATQTVNLIKGYNTLQIPMQIQPGVYVATLTAGSSSLSTKFVAQ